MFFSLPEKWKSLCLFIHFRGLWIYFNFFFGRKRKSLFFSYFRGWKNQEYIVYPGLFCQFWQFEVAYSISQSLISSPYGEALVPGMRASRFARREEKWKTQTVKRSSAGGGGGGRGGEGFFRRKSGLSRLRFPRETDRSSDGHLRDKTVSPAGATSWSNVNLVLSCYSWRVVRFPSSGWNYPFYQTSRLDSSATKFKNFCRHGPDFQRSITEISHSLDNNFFLLFSALTSRAGLFDSLSFPTKPVQNKPFPNIFGICMHKGNMWQQCRPSKRRQHQVPKYCMKKKRRSGQWSPIMKTYNRRIKGIVFARTDNIA